MNKQVDADLIRNYLELDFSNTNEQYTKKDKIDE